MKKMLAAVVLVASLGGTIAPAMAKEPKAKFYDFSDQLIDGEVKKPSTLYTDARSEVKFERLMTIKRSFIQDLLATAKERVFN